MRRNDTAGAGRRGRRIPGDPLRLYFNEMARIPVPSGEEQVRLARRLQEVRARLRQQVLETPAAAVEAIRLEGPTSELAARLRTLLADWRTSFDRLWWGSLDPAEVRGLRAALDRFRRRCAEELAALPLSSTSLRLIVFELESLSLEMDQVLRDLDAMPDDSAARDGIQSRRRQLMTVALENSRDLHARLTEIRATLRDHQAVQHEMVRSSLRLVVLIAREHLRSGVPLADLVQDGNLGLLKAVEMFDPSLGYRFTTYAKWWIRESIARGVSGHGKAFRVPVSDARILGRLRAAARALVHRLERTPSVEESAAEAGVEAGDARRVLRTASAPRSLEHPVRRGSRMTLGALIEDSRESFRPDAEAAVRVRSRIERALLDLPERTRRVIQLRFGLGRSRPSSRAEIAKSLSLSRERIRQIEEAALARLRLPQDAATLREFL